MLDDNDRNEVTRIVRDVANVHILARFGSLLQSDIAEKAPGDLVTVADHAAEDALTERLTTFLPGSVVVGEEAVANDPAVLTALERDDPVWIVDPLDGTHNFVASNPRFATLVALAHRGELLASWTYAPALDLMATAAAGQGAFVDGSRVRVASSRNGLRHLDVCVPQPRWWQGEQLNRLCATGIALCFLDTSGLEYVELAAGRRDAMIVTWEFPWDHAAGILLHAEAGGITLGGDGQLFRPAGGNHLPMVVAPDRDCAAALQRALVG